MGGGIEDDHGLEMNLSRKCSNGSDGIVGIG